MKKVSANWSHYLNYVVLFLLFLFVVQVIGLTRANAADSQLRAEIGPSNSYVILENSQIYVKYAPFSGLINQFVIKEFRIKSAGNENQVGDGIYNYFDAQDGRGPLQSASIIYNGTDRKTVRLIWSGFDYPSNPHPVTQEVSIFGDSKYLKVDYIDIQYTFNIVDLGKPGGTNNGLHVAYGHAGWLRGYVTFLDSSGQEPPPDQDSYYNRYAPDGLNDPADGGSLNYNNNFILGVYNPANGRGFGRVIPVANCAIIKLLLGPTSRRGLELYPNPFLKPHNSFTGYLYVVTGGESEIISMGQQLAGGGSSQGFLDVPSGYWAEQAINKVYNAGITQGCSQDPLLYCPDDLTTRDQMAVFLGKAKHGSSYTPPAATGIFNDVPTSYWAAKWIEQLYNDGITGGCSTSPLQYCPGNPVTRAQMAVFLLKAKHGSSYTPPAATGIFNDVPTSYWAASWIEQLYNEGITSGCSSSPLMYCPDDPVTRAQMAVFIANTFGL